MSLRLPSYLGDFTKITALNHHSWDTIPSDYYHNYWKCKYSYFSSMSELNIYICTYINIWFGGINPEDSSPSKYIQIISSDAYENTDTTYFGPIPETIYDYYKILHDNNILEQIIN